jgi:hypothetical protein
MNYKELEDKINALLAIESSKQRSKIAARRQVMMSLQENVKEHLERLEMKPNRVRRRPKITFTVSQTAVQRKNMILGVEMCGKNVGTLVLADDAHAKFEPKAKYSPKSLSWEWSKHPSDAENIRSFLCQVERRLCTNRVVEREIQGQLFEAISKLGRATAFENLQPVMLAGYPSEIATWITRKQKVGVGNIDVLVRRTQDQFGRGAQFLVFELKRPERRPNVAEALLQAITYALALGIESNGLDLERAQDRKIVVRAYRSLLGSNGTTELKFGAVAVVQDTSANREDAKDALEMFKLPNQKDRSRVDRLGVLFYKWDGATRKATAWHWYEGADPRKRSIGR